MAKILKTTFLLRRGLEEVWNRNNPVLQCGEPGFVIDKNQLKIGDGETAWRDLPYLDNVYEGDNNSVIIEDNILKLFGYEVAEVGARPQKGENGQLEWVVPASESVEELATIVTQIQNDLTQVTNEVEEVANNLTQVTNQITEVNNSVQKIEQTIIDKGSYKVASAPEGTLVSYRQKEIRIMCPSNTEWELQQSGENANPNLYYIGIKAYAPNNANSFKEDLKYPIEDQTIYYFENNDFAGIEEDGSKYSIVWLPVAVYDGSSWTYYGASSSAEQYLGWYYSVEWYDENGLMIGADLIRINLANENCYLNINPYYISDITSTTTEELKEYVNQQIQNVEVKEMDGGVIE